MGVSGGAALPEIVWQGCCGPSGTLVRQIALDWFGNTPVRGGFFMLEHPDRTSAARAIINRGMVNRCMSRNLPFRFTKIAEDDLPIIAVIAIV